MTKKKAKAPKKVSYPTQKGLLPEGYGHSVAPEQPHTGAASAPSSPPFDMVTAKAARLERVFQRLDRVDQRLRVLEGELATTLEIRNLLAEKHTALAKATECDRRVGLVLASDRALHLPGFPGTT